MVIKEKILKKVMLVLALVLTLLFAFSALAADKVVIIPLNSNPKGCPDGLTDCTGKCVDILNNPSYCGDCITPCAQDEYCDNGTCTNKYIPNCDDGNLCTDDSYDIQSQSCVHTNNTVSCDDGSLCTENDICSTGSCQGTPKDCSGSADQCNSAACDPQNGSCILVPLPSGTACGDSTNNECTAPDTCSGSGTCLPNNASPGTACNSDSNGCTADDYCSGGTCITGAAVTCSSDGKACTDDICNSTGNTTYTCTYPIWDGHCFIAGTCYFDGATNPTNVCQVCNAQASQGAWSSNTGACDDGDLCTENDTCSAGTCQGAPKDCSGLADQCNDASCAPQTGTCFTTPLTGNACDDGENCTLSDTCSAGGSCQGTWDEYGCGCISDSFCDDGNLCTINTCEIASNNCTYINASLGVPCDDGNPLTSNDICNGSGSCSGTP